MWAKLQWAEELLVILDCEIGAWIETRPYSFVTKFNDDNTRISVVAKVKSDPLLFRWSLMFSDIVHDLRCVLDHLVWAIAVHEKAPGFSPDKNRALLFPIWNDPPTGKDAGRIEILSRPVRTAIDSVQPYKAILHPSLAMHPLSTLAWLDNANKHKLLMMVRSCPGSGDVEVAWDGTSDPPEQTLHMGDIEDGTELLTLIFKTPQRNVKCKVEKLLVLIAIVYPVKTIYGTDRDDYAALVDRLIVEIKQVINVVTAAVV
jgi:hypothetical protein